MNKKNIIIFGIIIILIVSVIAYTELNKGTAYNDGTIGVVEFEKISSEIGYGVDIEKGDFPMDINLEKGKLNVKISKNNETIFEEKNINESKNIIANIPETGYYFLTISGKRAKGKINYPVSEIANTPEIDGFSFDESLVDSEIVKNAVEKHFKKEFENIIEEIKFNDVKIFSKDETNSIEILKELNLNDKDIVFKIDYELKIAENYNDIEQFTAATGEVDGRWVKNKYNCGVARYQAESNDYNITDFGTSF